MSLPAFSDEPEFNALLPIDTDLRLTQPSSQDLLLIDLSQGVATGACFYLAALASVQSLTPSILVAMVVIAAVWTFHSCYRLAWREAAMALGIAVGLASNLFAPILLFLFFAAGWVRGRRALTTPWAAMGLALCTFGVALAHEAVTMNLRAPQPEQLFLAYLVPLTIGAMGCATLSNHAVARARTSDLVTSLHYLGCQWLSVAAVVLSAVGSLHVVALLGT